MSSKPYDDRGRYEIDVDTIGKHILVVIRLKDDVRPTKRDFALYIKPGGYCIRRKHLKKLEECMENSPNVEAILAYLEVHEYQPRMTCVERNILNYWKYRRLAFEKK